MMKKYGLIIALSLAFSLCCSIAEAQILVSLGPCFFSGASNHNNDFGYGLMGTASVRIYFVGISFGFGGIWMDYEENEKKITKSDFLGNFFVEGAFPIIFDTNIDSDFLFGLGTLYSTKNKNNYALSVIKPDGDNGHPAAFALKYGVELIFKNISIHIWRDLSIGAVLYYNLGFKKYDESQIYGGTKIYHQLYLGIAVYYD